MLQAIGLTSAPRRGLPPVVDDLTFDARPGRVTALLGAACSETSTALRLMLELEPGRGVTYFKGRPLHRIAHPAREVGVLLGDVPGHPARTVRGQLRMLCAAAGVPASRADELLEVVGLAGLGHQRLGVLSLGMDRRLGLASALLGDPHTLVLDDPAKGLSPRELGWLYGLLRAHAGHGGAVLYTTSDPKEAAKHADRVVTVDAGRLVADQDAAEFARTRLRPRVAVRSPHAARLAAVVSREARAARRSVEVVPEDGSLLSVYGSSCAEVGDAAHRHGVLIHHLADEIGDTGPAPAPTGVAAPTAPADGPSPSPSPAPADGPSQPPCQPSSPVRTPGPAGPPAPALRANPLTAEPALHAPSTGTHLSHLSHQPPAPLPPPIAHRPPRGPLHPLRYELRRLLGVRTAPLVAAATVAASALLAVLLARTGRTPLPAALAGWPGLLPLPPAALGAGLIGALSFGDEFRHPALAAGRGTVPRRVGMLLTKLLVTGCAAVLLAMLVLVVDAEALRIVYGDDLIAVPSNWRSLAASWVGLSLGCAWAGLLAAGVFRATAAGVAAVLAVPILLVPLVRRALDAPSARSIAGLPARLRELSWVQWPYEFDRWLLGVVHVVAQPVGVALALSLSALLGAYLLTALRVRARW
ncbi:ATP-binding cassette domain-containing protein [Streptomyces sp. NPDC050504]|uniref:ATP-binding cassette domain-containing protein n=1 Tax=Streptomyces sp. NPDC050504 TaxID=3365618 RepID=UPI0037A215DB